MDNLFNFARESDDEQWISVSDLMAVLMMVFLLVSIAFIGDVLKDNGAKKIHEFNKLEHTSQGFGKIKRDLRFRLDEEFKDDFKKWNAELDEKELIIRFNNPKVFFEVEKGELKQKFKDILKVFFPKYLKILNESQFRDYVSEIRIEGHASSGYDCDNERDDYFCNMTLSQERSLAVLEFGLSETFVNRNKELKEWAKSLLTANGLSSSQLVCKDYDGEGKRIIASDCKEFGGENREASRRVEFEIRTNFNEKIIELLEDYNAE